MTALSDIQKALNTIRRITQAEEEAVRLAALALLAGVIGDEARDIAKRREPKPKPKRAQPAAPLPRSPKPTVRPAPMPQDKGVQTVPNVQALAPKQAQKPIPPQ